MPWRVVSTADVGGMANTQATNMTTVVQVLCPDHGQVDLTPDDLLLAPTVLLVHCAEVDHLFLLGLTPDTERKLVDAGVEQLCP
jgi:hypothetical protein